MYFRLVYLDLRCRCADNDLCHTKMTIHFLKVSHEVSRFWMVLQVPVGVAPGFQGMVPWQQHGKSSWGLGHCFASIGSCNRTEEQDGPGEFSIFVPTPDLTNACWSMGVLKKMIGVEDES